MDKEKEELERLAYALMLMEHFYSLEKELSSFRSVNGSGRLKELIPEWNELSNYFEVSIYKLLAKVDLVLAQAWDRSAYADVYMRRKSNEQ